MLDPRDVGTGEDAPVISVAFNILDFPADEPSFERHRGHADSFGCFVYVHMLDSFVGRCVATHINPYHDTKMVEVKAGC